MRFAILFFTFTFVGTLNALPIVNPDPVTHACYDVSCNIIPATSGNALREINPVRTVPDLQKRGRGGGGGGKGSGKAGARGKGGRKGGNRPKCQQTVFDVMRDADRFGDHFELRASRAVAALGNAIMRLEPRPYLAKSPTPPERQRDPFKGCITLTRTESADPFTTENAALRGMSGTETHGNQVNVDPGIPQETAISGEDYSNPIYRQSSPYGDYIAIIKAQIDEDMHDLEIFTARVEAEDVKTSKQTQILLELKAELEMLQKKQQETARQLLIERYIEMSFESQSLEFASRISSSIRPPGLMEIHFSNTDDALSFIRSTIESLNRAQEQCSASISELQSRLRIEAACLSLLSDRKHSFESICDEFRSSMKRKRAILSSKRLPTEILIQIFDMVVDGFIHNETLNSNPVGGHPALNIALVCHRWHDIAMDTSRLWRYIPIHGKREASSSVLLQIMQLCQRADQTRGLFLDLTCGGDEDNGTQLHAWNNGLELIARIWENMEGINPTTLSIHYRGEPMPLVVPFKKMHTYASYNLYPLFFPSVAAHVTHIVLHFRSQPGSAHLIALLEDLQNLTKLEVYFQGPHIRTGPALHASRPSLQCLAVRLSMVPLFFSAKQFASKVVQSLTVQLDTPHTFSFLNAERWRLTVESGCLATGLRYLALDGSNSLSSPVDKTAPLLIGLKSVITLAIYGPSMAPILHKLSTDPTLLPSLHRLEMHATDIDQTIIEGFLDSRREPREGTSAPVPIRELVLDHCSCVTQDFCDHIGGKVEKLVIYC